MILHELFWKVSDDDRRKGYHQTADGFVCLICGYLSERGIIYDHDGIFCDAEKNVSFHIESEHGSVFSYLIGLDRRLTGLSKHQRDIMRLFYEGESETGIRKKMCIGSASTVRQHRFALREKERQAKIFAALAELLSERESALKEADPVRRGPAFEADPLARPAEGVPRPSLMRAPGRRYASPGRTDEPGRDAVGVVRSQAEDAARAKVIEKYFPEENFGRLKTLSMKEKSRIIVLEHIASRFRPGVRYSEQEINSTLMEVYDDLATLKRYLVDYGLMERKPDGSLYWLAENDGKTAGPETSGKNENGPGASLKKSDENSEDEKMAMETTAEKPAKNENASGSKKDMKRGYREMKQEGGVYRIRNTVNNKSLVLATPNLKTVNGKLMQLRTGNYMNEALQAEWNRYGAGAFVVEVLESLDQADENFADKLEKIEKKWLEKLDPYGDRGYNSPGRKF